MDNSFGKEQRLKGKKVVSEIFGKEKKTVNSFPFRAFYVIENSSESGANFGVSVPKKKFKKAVDRNKIKRLVKEVIRLNKTSLLEELYKQSVTIKVMVVCNADSLPSYNVVEAKIKDLLSRLAQRIKEHEEN